MKSYNLTKWITTTALLMALVVATGYIPPVPIAVGRIYWCDAMIFFASFLVDPVSAFLIGGVGTFLYDILIGDAVMALVSLVVHGLQASVTALLIGLFPKKGEVVWAILSALVGAVVMIGGYFLWRWAISPLILSGDKVGLAYAVSKVPANLIQEGVGVVVAVLIVYGLRLKYVLKKNRLLPPNRWIFTKKKEA